MLINITLCFESFLSSSLWTTTVKEVKFFKYMDCGVILLEVGKPWKKQKEERMQNTLHREALTPVQIPTITFMSVSAKALVRWHSEIFIEIQTILTNEQRNVSNNGTEQSVLFISLCYFEHQWNIHLYILTYIFIYIYFTFLDLYIYIKAPGVIWNAKHMQGSIFLNNHFDDSSHLLRTYHIRHYF